MLAQLPQPNGKRKERLVPGDDLKTCIDDAVKNLSESHKTLHNTFLGALARAEATTDIEAKHAAIQEAKDHLLNGMQLAEEAYKGEVEACKRVHPS
jgi:hypothetical protein